MTRRAMAGQINEGSVPPYYREVYEALRCRSEERVQVEVFHRLLHRADLQKADLAQIAEHVEPSGGYLSKLTLYKALALIALAQQGKQPSPKLLENCIQELPRPQLGEPKDLASLRVQPTPDDPLTVAHSLDRLLARDNVQVELIPEKKGLFLKHVEYQVTSQHHKISVYRRYTDFDVFHELLVQRFAYRMREFIEGRRRALGRFVNLVARHPFSADDELVKIFLTFNGSDVQTKLRDSYKRTGDEFITNRIATQAKEYLPTDIQNQFSASRELIRNIHNSFHKLRDRAEKMAERSKGNATDLLICILHPLAGLLSEHLGDFAEVSEGLSVEFALLSEKAGQQGRREEDDVVEKLNFFLDLLQSYRGVLHEHQRALQKYSVMKRQMMSATAAQTKEPVSVEQLESRIVQQENAIQIMELRNYFSLFCLHQETQLIFTYLPMTYHILGAFVKSQVQGHAEQENAIQIMELRNYFSLFCLHQETQLIFTYLPMTYHILGAFVKSQVQGHAEMGEVWNELQPKLGFLFDTHKNKMSFPRRSSSLLFCTISLFPHKRHAAVHTTAVLGNKKTNLKGKSSAWLTRQLSDPYVKASRVHNYRCRSAFKLLEIDDKYRLLAPGRRVLPRGTVVGVDLLNIAPLDGAHFLSSHDITDPATHARLRSLLPADAGAGAMADVILSDMAPNASGFRDMDKERLVAMCLSLVDLSEKLLRPGGSLLCKYWDGFAASSLQRSLAAVFGDVRSVKPKASRKESSEAYFLARMYRTIKQ
ncbi:hypothetical protein CRUP_028650 [Coryphaenoides rupestris]|nr:hypothetical protein CRUP_028650 [Coryphaenoides rupestris]